MRGKTVVVTGGFGALGRVVAEVAAALGASVAVLDHASAPPEGMAERLGADALLIGGLDLSSPEAATKAMADVKAKFGRLDALLNIAGGFQWETVEGGKGETWERMYALNLMTALNACGPRCHISSRAGPDGSSMSGRSRLSTPHRGWAPTRRANPRCTA